MKITLADEIKELEREIATRKNVYPKWIPHRLKRDVANHRVLCLQKTLERLKRLDEGQNGEQLVLDTARSSATRTDKRTTQ